jgi:RNA polymerase sigma-70 factor (ECF subfamily)
MTGLTIHDPVPTKTTTLTLDEDDWTLLIVLIARGSQSALSHLYDRSSPRVYGLILSILDDRGAAEEVTIDVYMQVWRTASRFDPSRGSVIGWLQMIARSRAIDRLRAGHIERRRVERPECLDGVLDAGDDPETWSLRSEQGRLVREALTRLSPEQREAILLAYFSGLSHSEIAARQGLPVGTVKTRIRLGMQKLRDLLLPVESGSEI